ncbi:hypothetical protein [Streptomyces cyaneofuscatus]|uniref:hypothetical protein n=1 Tax=Streptomyces cyaneofuscatus TaxID=66883 RepID=UPI002E103494|nr:hypothetical protein OG366_33445 [Streptomyces cyaneofuscatus]
MSWLAGYYLRLHDLIRHGPRAVVPGWDEAVAAVRTLAVTTRLVLTTQLGHALMVPLLVEEATGRRTLPIVHDRNPLVRTMYEERLRLGEPLLLTRLGAGDIRRWLAWMPSSSRTRTPVTPAPGTPGTSRYSAAG